jgi:hypothetical protein
MAARRAVGVLGSRFAEDIVRLLLPGSEVLRSEDAKAGVRVVDQPIRAVPLEDNWTLAVVGGGDAFGCPVNEVGGIAEVDLGAVGLVLVPESPVARGEAEDTGVDGALGLKVGIRERRPVEQVFAGEVLNVAGGSSP